jgi:hypothetical protein
VDPKTKHLHPSRTVCPIHSLSHCHWCCLVDDGLLNDGAQVGLNTLPSFVVVGDARTVQIDRQIITAVIAVHHFDPVAHLHLLGLFGLIASDHVPEVGETLVDVLVKGPDGILNTAKRPAEPLPL